jgi:hypothetical protein
MTWLIVIVRLGRAAPRHRRRVFAELEDAGAVRVAEGVWALPNTAAHRKAVDAADYRAATAGGDLVLMQTTADNAPSHDVLEAALAERLTSEAKALSRRWDEFASVTLPGPGEGTGADEREAEFISLQRDARRLSGMDVMGLDAVATVVARVQRTAGLQEITDAA